MPQLPLADNVPLAPLCTLGLGGPARHFAQADNEQIVLDSLRWAEARGLPVGLLGGGSNLVIADGGFPGLVVHLKLRGRSFSDEGGRCLVTAQAGEPWDELVAACVARGLGGIECLSGIPGSAGATPVQNVGAYGQEVAEVITRVRVLDRDTLAIEELEAAACGFGYRDSRFKRAPGRHVVLAVTFALLPGGAPALRYPELAREIGGEIGDGGATLAQVREAVLRLRRRKSMVIDPEDENRRSVGSFFMNPVVPPAAAEAVVERALQLGVAQAAADVPRYPAPEEQVKLSAGWLIERAGIRKGERCGAVGVSSRHALALVHHGGGRTEELLALARRVQRVVLERFGVKLQAEPAFWGFAEPPL